MMEVRLVHLYGNFEKSCKDCLKMVEINVKQKMKDVSYVKSFHIFPIPYNLQFRLNLM